MSVDATYQVILSLLPLGATVVVMWIAIRLFHERPGEFFRAVVQELLSIFERRLSLRAINLIGALIMLILTLLVFAEGLLQTIFEAIDHSRPSAANDIYNVSLRYGVIFFFGIYFLISIAIAKRER